jgi:hypothetical protein
MSLGIRVVLYAAGILLLAALHLLRLLKLDRVLLLRLAGGARDALSVELVESTWRQSSIRPPL